jgi:AcrR family transcriptional regulator
MPDEDGGVRRRRRGTELEQALLTAAWQELMAVGYAKLTMESVAERARTGVAVLYRRWSDKNALVLAAIRAYGERRSTVVPDTGNLRDDLLALLEIINQEWKEFATLIGTAAAGLLESTGLTLADFRLILIGEGPFRSDRMFRRAHERGEIDLDRIPQAVLDLPFQLLRHDIVMTMRPASPERIRSIADDLFWPLVRR